MKTPVLKNAGAQEWIHTRLVSVEEKILKQKDRPIERSRMTYREFKRV